MDSITTARLLAKYTQQPTNPYGGIHRGVVWTKVPHVDLALSYTYITLNGTAFRIHGRCSNSRMWTFIDEVLDSGVGHTLYDGELTTTTTKWA